MRQENTGNPKNGFVLVFTILLILGVTSIAVGTLYRSKMNRITTVNYKNKIQTFNAADGVMTILAQEIINGNQNKYLDTSRYGKVYAKVWTGFSGNAVSLLKARMASQPVPNYTDSSYYLGSNWNFDNYGVKWSGWLMPPVSGSYIFYTRSDDASSFYLSTDNTSGNLPTAPTCSLASWTDKWPTSGPAVSRAITLLAGKRYYFEYLHKEGNGGDYGQMGWDGPEWLSERPITGKYISKYASDPAYSGTVNVGAVPVKYRVVSAGLDSYGLFAESALLRPGSSTDTAFRTPINQFLSIRGNATAPPSRIWMRVILYDFHSNGSNPEFEKPHTSGVSPGMVETKLTINPLTNTANASYFGLTTLKKPRRKANTYLNRNCLLDKWFVPWTDPNTSGTTFNGPRYSNNGDCTTTSMPDTAMKNYVIRDSIPFDLDLTQGPNTYVFSRMGNYPDPGDPVEPYFFWLDGKPGTISMTAEYGTDPNGVRHNYASCMELHTTFQHQSGLTFKFNGDDDVWVFINDSLVMDLGGFHPPTSDEVYLDDITNLLYGNTYPLDMYYCERHTTESTCRIVTNIPVVRTTGAPIASWKRDYGSVD